MPVEESVASGKCRLGHVGIKLSISLMGRMMQQIGFDDYWQVGRTRTLFGFTSVEGGTQGLMLRSWC